MKFKLFILSTATIILNINVANMANAADAIIYESPTTIYNSFTWTGGYIGGQIGYNWGRTRLSDNNNSNHLRTNGFLGGLYAGYNYAFDEAYIIGIEGDINYTDPKHRIHLFGNNRNTAMGSRPKWEGAIRGRIGIGYERIMPYLAAGVAFVSLKDEMWDTENGISQYRNSNRTRVGWTIGAGIDYALTDNWMMRAEYRYSDFRKKTLWNTGIRSHYKSQSVRLGVAYKF